MKISIIGTGYVGTVTGASFADLGHQVFFVDIDPQKVEEINNAQVTFFEPGLEELIKKNKKSISASTDTKDAVINSDCTFICVNTPSNPDGTLNTQYIENAAAAVGEAIGEKQDRHTVIIKSTVLPGTTEDIILPRLETASRKNAFLDFGLCVNPEFLKEGCAIQDFTRPDRIVFGVRDNDSRKMLDELYKSFTCPKFFTTIKTAEMIKYVSNAFLATKISFSNEIGNLCKEIGIEAPTVFAAVGLDPRINPFFFRSGIGFGGSCFPKDLNALSSFAHEKRINPALLNAVLSINNLQPIRMISLLKRHVPDLRGKQIGILGLAFKPDTDDIRESRAIPIVENLVHEGCRIVAFDPKAMDNFRKMFPKIEYADAPEQILSSDAILIVTEWGIFNTLDYRNKIVIDGRFIENAKKNAKVYEGVCW
nr:UDP-glucose/GDP-mannose dehydrogenase family protein [uncultured Methanoregula sp.]